MLNCASSVWKSSSAISSSTCVLASAGSPVSSVRLSSISSPIERRSGSNARLREHPREHVEAELDLVAVALAVLAGEGGVGDLVAHGASLLPGSVQSFINRADPAQSMTSPTVTRVTLPPEIRKSRDPLTGEEVARVAATGPSPNVSHLTPLDACLHAASLDPTPTPFAVRSPRPVVSTDVTSSGPGRSRGRRRRTCSGRTDRSRWPPVVVFDGLAERRAHLGAGVAEPRARDPAVDLDHRPPPPGRSEQREDHPEW